MVQAVVSWDARLVEQVLGKQQRAINKAFSSWVPFQEVLSFQAKSLCPDPLSKGCLWFWDDHPSFGGILVVETLPSVLSHIVKFVSLCLIGGQLLKHFQ